MKKRSTEKTAVVIYQARDGSIELRGDLRKETIWATQAEIVRLFGVDQSVVSRHIKNIFKDGEIDEKSNMQKMHSANSDKPVVCYSLDVILGIGYRTNSKVAIEFRQWATKTLRQYIVGGYAINKKRIATNYAEFQKAVDNVKLLLPAGSAVDSGSIVELMSAFADTWLSLDAYDRDTLVAKGSTRKSVELTAEQLGKALETFKQTLSEKGEASDLFGVERTTGTVSGIVGNVMQTFDGKPLYPTIEEKAAHLLYFMVKNHPYIDGNKRSGAYSFVWFLHRTGVLDRERLTAPALTALTLLIAESNPTHKERMINVVLQLLRK